MKLMLLVAQLTLVFFGGEHFFIDIQSVSQSVSFSLMMLVVAIIVQVDS